MFKNKKKQIQVLWMKTIIPMNYMGKNATNAVQGIINRHNIIIIFFEKVADYKEDIMNLNFINDFYMIAHKY